MYLEFTKMHGLGNDFMVVDLITQRAYLDTLTIQRLADRHFGVGFDQLLIVEPPDFPDVDLKSSSAVMVCVVLLGLYMNVNLPLKQKFGCKPKQGL